MEPTKEQLCKQIEVGLNYADCENWTREQVLDHMADHLWGTVGMWLKHPVHTGVDEIDEHEAEIMKAVRDIPGPSLIQNSDNI